MFFTIPEDQEIIDRNVDEFGDSYCRDLTIDELKAIFDDMSSKPERAFESVSLLTELDHQGIDIEELPGCMFSDLVIYFDQTEPHDNSPEDLRFRLASQTLRFAGARITKDLDDTSLTHVVMGEDKSRVKGIRTHISKRKKLPRIVSLDWVEDSWKEKTLLDEERFAVL